MIHKRNKIAIIANKNGKNILETIVIIFKRFMYLSSLKNMFRLFWIIYIQFFEYIKNISSWGFL